MYKRVIKRMLDLILSSAAIVVLALPMLIIAAIIKMDDPGPVLFRQKRVGKKKNGEITYFTILKFRSMPTTVPKDLPTHQFSKANQLSRWQRFIRKTSLDELPQIFNIFCSQMSIIGPRPALWNQEDLIAERDKYGANDIKPGLTGWAQINGRDELEISEKAKLDGEYVSNLSFWFDVKCFFGTILSVLRHDGVVEGGTGEMNRQEQNAQEAIHK